MVDALTKFCDVADKLCCEHEPSLKDDPSTDASQIHRNISSSAVSAPLRWEGSHLVISAGSELRLPLAVNISDKVCKLYDTFVTRDIA